MCRFKRPDGRKLWVLSLLLVTCSFLQAQDYDDDIADLVRTDSMLQHNPIDTNALWKCSQYLSRLAFLEPDTTIYFGQRLVQYARSQGDVFLESSTLQSIGQAHEALNRLDEAIEIYQEALDMLSQFINSAHLDLSDPAVARAYKIKGYVSNDLSIAYSFKGLYGKSLQHAILAYESMEQLNKRQIMASFLTNIGLRHTEMLQPEKALEYYRRSLALYDELGLEEPKINTYVNMAISYGKLAQLDSGLHYLSLARKLIRVPDNESRMVGGYSAYAYLYLRAKQYSIGLQYCDSLAFIANKFNNIQGVQQAKIMRGLALFELDRYEDALPILEQTTSDAIRYGMANTASDQFKSLSKIYAKRGEYQKAFEALGHVVTSFDSTYIKQKDDANAQMVDYMAAKAEAENKLLAKEIDVASLRAERAELARNFYLALGALLVALAFALWRRFLYVKKAQAALALSHDQLREEKTRSDNLLLNILPYEVAEELKANGSSEARSFDNVTVLFTDFENFTSIAATLSPDELVKEVDLCFKKFDEIVEKHGIEKIKTIGDAYMAAGGLGKAEDAAKFAKATVQAAIEMQAFIESRAMQASKEGRSHFRMRLGVHSGPVVAGIVGIKKFQYDIWGDTVNTASRMENMSASGKVNISDASYALVADAFTCVARGQIDVPGKGLMQMYYVEG